MGQYYKPVIICQDGSVFTANSHDYDNGIKIMEHSWVGNNFVNAVLGMMEDKPARLAWIGDYADSVVADECDLGGGFITSRDRFMEYYHGVWGESGETTPRISKDTKPFLLDGEHADCFVVNKTKECYIDMEHYDKENDIKGWCVNPVPLLTSIGNGQGGGDYYSEIGADDVGSWAFDEIYVTALRPASPMYEKEYHFREE